MRPVVAVLLSFAVLSHAHADPLPPVFVPRLDPSTLPPPEPCVAEYVGDAQTRCVERSVTVKIQPSVDPAVIRYRMGRF